MKDSKGKRIAIAMGGNPNAGKTTIFNCLTGIRQRVGNYPGVTVEKTEGTFSHLDHEITAIDLPGTYSLTAHSADELVTRNYVIEEHPDIVVDIVDSANLERNLYLAVQFMELGVPLILVFNKNDVAETRGLSVNAKMLSDLFNVAVVETVAHRGTGIDVLKDAIVDLASSSSFRCPTVVRYGREIENEIEQLGPMIERLPTWRRLHNSRWLAVKLLENDEEVKRKMAETPDDTAGVLSAAQAASDRISRHFGDPTEIVIADQRYGFISGACQEAVKSSSEVRHSMSDRIDEIVTNRVLGIPIFLMMMYLLFKTTFTLGAPAMEWIELGVAALGRAVSGMWPAGSESALRSLFVDGIIAGVGGVVMFLPNILLLFAAIAILEDSGYMARGVFIMDRLMHRIGLHGKSFIPVMVGFGCTVPAILATRTLESRRNRLATMLVLPLISCSARFPIYALFIPAFFPENWRARILMILYLTGIILAALMAKLLRVTILKGETPPFVMELPPYRLPTFRGIMGHTWERGRMFVRKAGTVIVLASIILWGLTNYPKPQAEKLAGLDARAARSLSLSSSIAGRVGMALEPAMRHIGFDWQTTTAMIGAFAAKEIFVAQLGIVYSLGGEVDEESESLRRILQREYTPLQAFCIMLFCLISIPCVATIAATRAESGGWRWAILQLIGLTVLAYVVTLAVYQAGQYFVIWFG